MQEHEDTKRQWKEHVQQSADRMGSQGDQGKQKLADVLGVDESQVSDEAEKRWQEGMKDKDPDELRRSLRDDDDDWADRIYDALAEGGKPHQKGSSHANR